MAIDNQTNAFSGGMNQDIAPQYLGSPQYRSATDIRIVANNNSTFEAQNIRGDSFVFQFPQNVVGREYSLICFDSDGPFPWTPEIVVTYNSVSRNTGVNTPTSDTIPIGPYLAFNIQQIIDDINAITVFATFTLGDYLDIEVDGCDGTCIRVRVKGTFQFTLGTPDNLFDNTLDSVSVAPLYGTTTFETIPAQSNFQIVGYGSDSESLVLITTSVSDGEPIQQIVEPDPLYPRTYGQVWELDISAGKDNIPGLVSPGSVLDPAVHLRYNDQLGLYLKYAFFDEVEVVRENDCIVRIYWTDNFNPPRQMNIGDGFVTLPPDQLEFTAPAKFGPVDFVRYTEPGQLNEGIYRFTYRYVGTDNQPTAFAPVFQGVEVFGQPTDTYRTRIGNDVGLPSGYGVEMQVSNVDTSYARIQIVALYFAVPNGIPDVWVVNDLEIQGNSTITFKVEDNIERFAEIPITPEEILNLGIVSISKAKNLKVAQDRLYLSNFCEAAELDFDTSGLVYEARTAPLYIGDFINTDFTPPVPSPPVNTIVHGSERITEPDAFTGKTIYNNFRDFKGPDANYYRKGYWNDERYRFGILFYAKDGTRYPVKWLTDFDFPALNVDEPDTTAGAQLFQFVEAGGLSGLRMFVNHLHIAGIDVSSIADSISGFSIVRAPRDPRVIGMGVVMPVLRYSYIEFDSTELLNTEYFDLERGRDTVFPTVALEPVIRKATTKFLRTHAILSPEIDFSPSLDTQVSAIRVNGYIGYKSINTTHKYYVGYPAGSPLGQYLFKVYERLRFADHPTLTPIGTLINTNYTEYLPTALPSVEFGGIYADRGFLMSNFPEVSALNLPLIRMGLTVGPGITQNLMRGGVIGDRLLVSLETDLNLPLQGPTYLLGDPNEALNAFGLVTLYNNKERDLQYGGQGDNALASTEYIFCGHYQPVDDCNKGDGNYVYAADVFGGDCLPTVYDRKFMYGTFNWADTNVVGTTPLNLSDDGIARSTPYGFIFPVQTSLPLLQRTGQYFNSPSDATEPSFFIATNAAPVPTPYRETYEVSDPLWGADNAVDAAAAEDPRTCGQVCYPNWIIPSQRKVRGELVDSFRRLLINDQAELELTRGPINHMDILQNVNSDRIYFWQDSGFGFVPFNERVAITTSGEAVMGSGTLFGTPSYINRVVGSIHKNSVFRSGRAFYWYDANTQELYRFAADGVTALTNDNGLRSWIRESYRDGLLGEIGSLDNMLYTGGIQGYYDNEHDEAVFMFSKIQPGIDPETEQFVVTPQGHDGICFKEGVSKFTSFYTQDHGLYMPIYGNRIFVTAPPYAYANPTPDQRYISWKFASDLYVPGASIQFVVNKSPQDTKTLASMVAIMNRLWSLFSIESSPNQKWNQAAVRHLTNSAFYRWQPRGGKWQGPVTLVKNSEEIDLSTVPPTIVPRLEYGGKKMSGEYFLIEYLTNSTEFRTLLAVTTMFHNSQTTR